MFKSAVRKTGSLFTLLLILSAFAIASPFIYTYEAYAEGPPGLPHQFYGTVSSGGAVVGTGYTVTAKIAGSQVAASTTDSQGRYGYSTPMQVTGQSGQTIEFYVNSALASPTAVCNPGTVTPLNLSTGTTPPAGCGITTASLPAGTVGTAYSASLAASGGTTPYTWTISSGTLPAGLSLNGANGMVSGIPTTAQTSSFTVQANDSASHYCNRSLSIQVNTGAPAATVVSVSSSILGSTDTFSLSNSVLAAAKDLASSDGRVRFSLPAGSTINMQGMTQLGAATESNPPAASDNSTLIRAYSFAPSGATFAPAATMSLKYDAASLPSGASESNLYVAYWTGTAWQYLTSTVNTSTKEVSAQVTHFTIFAIRYLPPATTTTTTTTSSTTSTTTTTSTPTSISANVLGTTSSFSISGGTVPSAASLSSSNGKMSISLAANTAVSMPAGSQQIVAIPLANMPTPPANNKVIEAYAFGPDNATFSPAASVTLKYDPAGLPADVQESNLYLALLENTNWTEIPSTVNTQAKTVTAQVSHFSIYALLGRVTAAASTPAASTTPATPSSTTPAFSTSDMSVSPQSAKAGETVTVSVRVVNGGTSEATKTVVLKINDQVESQQDVKLVPGKSQVVSFNVVRADPGQYKAGVDGQSASFSITAAGGEAPSGMSIPILVIIIAGGLLVIVLVIVLVVRQRSSGY